MQHELQQLVFPGTQRTSFSLLFLHSELHDFNHCLLITEKGKRKTSYEMLRTRVTPETIIKFVNLSNKQMG